MAGIMLQNLEDGAKFRFVQIGGGTANFTALTGNQTNVSVLSAAEVLNFTRLPDGSENPESEIRPLAYTGAERAAKLPDVPTMNELGYDMQFCVDSWWFAPRGTPRRPSPASPPHLKATDTPQVQAFDEKAFGAVFLRGDELQASLDETWARIEPVAKQAAQN